MKGASAKSLIAAAMLDAGYPSGPDSSLGQIQKYLSEVRAEIERATDASELLKFFGGAKNVRDAYQYAVENLDLDEVEMLEGKGWIEDPAAELTPNAYGLDSLVLTGHSTFGSGPYCGTLYFSSIRLAMPELIRLAFAEDVLMSRDYPDLELELDLDEWDEAFTCVQFLYNAEYLSGATTLEWLARSLSIWQSRSSRVMTLGEFLLNRLAASSLQLYRGPSQLVTDRLTSDEWRRIVSQLPPSGAGI